MQNIAIILDTETTGLQQPEPVEIAVLYMSELSFYGENLDSLENLLLSHRTQVNRYRPTKPIEPTASKLHGIYLEDLSECITYNAQQFTQFFELHSVQYIIGHTIDYDLRTLKCVPGFSDESHFQWKPIDICKIARKCWPEFKEGRGGYKLTQIMEKLLPGMKEVVEQKAHGAMADVYFTYLILAAIIHQYEPTSWEDVYNLQF